MPSPPPKKMLTTGTMCTITGLKTATFNGVSGVVMGPTAGREGRLNVMCTHPKTTKMVTISVKALNVQETPMPNLPGGGAPGAGVEDMTAKLMAMLFKTDPGLARTTPPAP